MAIPNEDLHASLPERQGLDAAKLDAAMDVLARITGREGTSRCVAVRNGCIVWSGDDVDTLCPVWSCTKSFLSATLGLLIDDGKCHLDTLAADIYPAMAEHYPSVTLRHLATFTSGYRPREVSETVPPFAPAAPLFAPGEAFHYSWDPYLLALLLTKVAGESLADLFGRRIAEPIGLDAQAWQWGDWGAVDQLTGLDGVPVCGGSGAYGKGVSITARALARIGWLFACGGKWNGEQLIGRAFLDEATRSQVPPTTPPHDPDAWYAHLPGRYGLYWWANGADVAGHRLWPSAPASTVAMVGNHDNVCFVIPNWHTVVVRLGTDGPITNDHYGDFLAALCDALS